MTSEQLSTLTDILSHRRPYGTRSERAFTRRYVLTLPGAELDTHGNVHVEVGNSRVLFSCHTDTVHRSGGRQRVFVDRDGYVSRGKQASDCLGADDGVGVFLMREMILAGVAGYYVFHNGEEKGGIGSSALAWSHADMLTARFDYAIAFDRRGTQDIITHQAGGRTASRAFAKSLARMFNAHGLKYRPNDGGIYTDTAEYADLIPECTNVSVGYYNEHRAVECLDTLHVGKLLAALLAFDETVLVCKRNPAEDRAPVIVTRKVDSKIFRYADYVDDWPEDRVEGKPRVYNGVCELCQWPGHMCQCTEEDITFWKYLNGYK